MGTTRAAAGRPRGSLGTAMAQQPEDHGIRAVIDGQPVSLFVDYDRPRLIHLSDDGKLDYFSRRFQFVVVEPLAVLLDEHDSPRHGANRESSVLLIWGNTLLCATEALGHYLTSDTATNAHAFQKFVSAFMDPAWKERPEHPPGGVDSYCRWLWDSFRNGLAHGAYVKNGGFEKLGDRLFVETAGGLLVDPWALDIDFRSGVRKFFQTLHDPSSVFRASFVRRFDRTYIHGES